MKLKITLKEGFETWNPYADETDSKMSYLNPKEFEIECSIGVIDCVPEIEITEVGSSWITINYAYDGVRSIGTFNPVSSDIFRPHKAHLDSGNSIAIDCSWQYKDSLHYKMAILEAIDD